MQTRIVKEDEGFDSFRNMHKVKKQLSMTLREKITLDS